MSNFLRNIIYRHGNPDQMVKPRLRGLFEPRQDIGVPASIFEQSEEVTAEPGLLQPEKTIPDVVREEPLRAIAPREEHPREEVSTIEKKPAAQPEREFSKTIQASSIFQKDHPEEPTFHPAEITSIQREPAPQPAQSLKRAVKKPAVKPPAKEALTPKEEILEQHVEIPVKPWQVKRQVVETPVVRMEKISRDREKEGPLAAQAQSPVENDLDPPQKLERQEVSSLFSADPLPRANPDRESPKKEELSGRSAPPAVPVLQTPFISQINQLGSVPKPTHTSSGERSPVIKIHIGRVEVRAVHPNPREARQKKEPQKPRTSLEEFLKNREGKSL